MDSSACVKISKKVFLNRLCEKKACTLKEASDIYEVFIDTLRDELLNGNEVIFSGFGSFALRLHKGHKIRFARGDDNIDDYLMLKFQLSPTFNKKYLKSNEMLIEKIRQRENQIERKDN